jgi:hypothetical protein
MLKPNDLNLEAVIKALKKIQDVKDGKIQSNKSTELAIKMTEIKWVAMSHPDDICDICKAATLERSSGLFFGPWSGSVRCTSCDYKDTFASYVGRKSIVIEPLK